LESDATPRCQTNIKCQWMVPLLTNEIFQSPHELAGFLTRLFRHTCHCHSWIHWISAVAHLARQISLCKRIIVHALMVEVERSRINRVISVMRTSNRL